MTPEHQRQVELLSRYFFSRKDAIAGSLNAQPPQPISATSPLEAVLLTHVEGNTVPTAKATTLKSGSTGFWSGHYRVGSYTPNADGTTAWLCLDFDRKGSGTKKGTDSHGQPSRKVYVNKRIGNWEPDPNSPPPASAAGGGSVAPDDDIPF